MWNEVVAFKVFSFFHVEKCLKPRLVLNPIPSWLIYLLSRFEKKKKFGVAVKNHITISSKVGIRGNTLDFLKKAAFERRTCQVKAFTIFSSYFERFLFLKDWYKLKSSEKFNRVISKKSDIIYTNEWNNK